MDKGVVTRSVTTLYFSKYKYSVECGRQLMVSPHLNSHVLTEILLIFAHCLI